MHADVLKRRQMVKGSIEMIGEESTALSSKFYTHLFHIDPQQHKVFDGCPVSLNRKFNNMLATFKHLKHLEKITPAIESLSKRHMGYGMQLVHHKSFKVALLHALEEQLEDQFTDELKLAWADTYDEVAGIMKQISERHPELFKRPTAMDAAHHEKLLLEELGGPEVIKSALVRFYDIIFDDPWLGQFFYGKNKNSIINKQPLFMIAAFGGRNQYKGEPPALSHMHMFITEEMSLEREKMLRKAILDEGISIENCERWLHIDRLLWPSIIKGSVEECVTKCFGQAPHVIKKPTVLNIKQAD